MIIYCDGEEIQTIMEDCHKICTENACEKCALHNAVCAKTGGKITFRVKRKDNPSVSCADSSLYTLGPQARTERNRAEPGSWRGGREPLGAEVDKDE